MFQAQFIRTNEKITAKAGMVPFAELIKKMDVSEAANALLRQKNPILGYPAASYLQTLLLSIYSGAESLRDTQKLRFDHALREVLDDMIVPSESALGDWLRFVGKDGIAALAQINKQVVHKMLIEAKIKAVTLGFDPSFIVAEKDNAKMTYEGFKGYRPDFATIVGLGLVVNARFKEGNDNGGRLELIKGAYDNLPPGVKVELALMDSEYYQADVINNFNEVGTPWIITADQDVAVQAAIKTIPNETWSPFVDKDGTATGREIAETVHCMNNVGKSFRLVVLRWKDKKTNEYIYHCKATDINDGTASQIVYKYNPRANVENDIKEVKNGFSMRKMPCGTFDANAVFFGIGVLACNLFIAQKMFTMPKELAAITIKIARWMLIEHPGKVVHFASEFKVFIAASRECFTNLIFMRKKTDELFKPC
jgi:DDE family transposase